ncbi:Macrolide export protein MacA [Anatilimnocola aggregata]|uniref:Macrolide export protein MacA n=1 Tax=Anatilimnocola aggregata TaxID=2528021 RepID=A0A517Y967_9BACT|nr:efflux RND transporter periplasmic adaptor subunit [Anatilimnocola aggregata]QDU26770.1 Macrolide export protein MacA [Anatilimnocola aggregata]
MKVLMGFLVVAVLSASAYFYTNRGPHVPQANYRTQAIERGDIYFNVGATGTVEPEEVIDVGAQVMGRIKEIGKDPRGKSDPNFASKTLDYGSPVEEGMVLVQIDPAVYRAQRDQAQATLDRAKADLLQFQARADHSEAEWKRAQKLYVGIAASSSGTGTGTGTGTAGTPKTTYGSAISDSDYLLAKANYGAAKANVEVGKSVIAQSTSALSLAETNLGYTTITSPVSGTIIDRRVNMGQTVVANLNTPSLFLIAKDLRRMQVWASVNEADIGLVKVNTPVHFKVDAFPKDTFYGTVTQIRLNASMSQNVVTYTVVITTDNSNQRLLPYLTADVKFEIEKRHDALIVPNVALRYKPQRDRISPADRESVPQVTDENQGLIWIQEENFVRPLLVTIGLTDGSSTEVSGAGIEEGRLVVLGEKSQAASDETNNPFAPPKIPRNKQTSAGQNE